eukprot:Rmarinus@m.19210
MDRNFLDKLPKEELIQMILNQERSPVRKRQRREGTDFIKPKKTKKGFDMSKYCQRKVAFKIYYFGKRYRGFASLVDSTETIEGKLFDALLKTCLITDRESANYSRCGRTDAGVSAFGQVVSLKVRSNLTEGPDLIAPEGWPPPKEKESR